MQPKASIQEKDYIEYRGKTKSEPLVKEINIDFRATHIKYLIVKSKRDIPKLIRTIKSAKKLVDYSDDFDIFSTNIITIEQLNNDF